MTAAELFAGLLPDAASLTGEIDTLTERADEAKDGSLFFCIRGARFDGHTLAEQAYENGCRHFVAQAPLSLPDDATVCIVPDTRRAQATLACKFFGHPSHRMRLIGITGTKGKTTTAQLLAQILNENGIACGYIGTNGITYASVRKEAKNTTPDAITLQKTLCRMQEKDVFAAVIEVSSQALMQYRADGTCFESVLFTNLSPDHIGTHEHPDFNHYMQCKKRLFSEFGARTILYNADDPHATDILSDASGAKKIACSTQAGADYSAHDLKSAFSRSHVGISFTVRTNKEDTPIDLSLAGEINAANALLALATAHTVFGISIRQAARTLSHASVEGRSELIPLPNGACVIIDYAHNGVSLRSLLTTLRAYRPLRLLCLFGSVGGRAQIRRKELSEAAAELADLSILTSDNPGTEDADAILAELAEVYRKQGKSFVCIPDRADAIRAALDMMQEGDMLVLAGKGHENYQLIGTQKLPFSEKSIVEAHIAVLSAR